MHTQGSPRIIVGLVALCALSVAPRHASAQARPPATDVERPSPLSPPSPERATRSWFVSVAFGFGHNSFGLSSNAVNRSWSAWGPSFTVQGGLRFRRLAAHVAVMGNVALSPEFNGLSDYGPWPASNLMHVLLGAGVTLFIPSTPLHLGATVGLDGMFVNFQGDSSYVDYAGRRVSNGPNSRANVGFGGALQAGASIPIPKFGDILVEANALLGTCPAGDTAPLELASVGETGTWTIVSVSAQVGARF